MSNAWTYTITHYDRSDTFLTTNDLSDDLIGIPLFTDTGSGIFNSAVVFLSLATGKYVTQSPLIEDLDRIRITAVDDNANTYDAVYDVMKRTVIKDEVSGTRLQLTLLGTEHWLDKFNFSQPGFFKNAREMSDKLFAQYQESRAGDNPFILNTDYTGTTDTIDFPIWTINNYDFGVGPERIYQRLIDLADKLGGSVENGGVLDYYDVRPLYDATSVHLLTMEAFPSGNPDVTSGNEVTITDTIDVAVSNVKGALDSIQGNVINAFGDDISGSLPVGYTKFRSAEERFDLAPEFISGVDYPAGALVQLAGTRYVAVSSTGGVSPPAGVWTSLTRANDYGNVFQYSPWTVDKAVAIWQNSGGDPSGVLGPYGGDCQFDSNITIWGDDVFRVGVDTVQTAPTNIPVFLKYGESSLGDYSGLRALVNGTGTGDWAGNDSNGVAYANSVVEYDNDKEEWLVKYPAVTGMYVAVFDVAKVYLFSGGSWSDVTFTAGSFGSGKGDCFHPTDAGVINVPGIIDTFSLNDDSAVAASYRYNPITANTTNRNAAEYYKQGAWLGLRFPLPVTSWNSITEDPGDIFGGGTQGVSGPKEPSTLDIQNNEWSPLGQRGWNQGEQTENLGQISSIDLFMKLKDEIINISETAELTPFQANFKIRCTCTDLNDNTAIQDFILDFNNEWQAVQLPISGFSVIRNRRPKEIADLLIPPKELNTTNNFEWRHVKSITFQTQESYDAEGRYDPQIGRYGLPNILSFLGGFTGVTRRITMHIDAFRFTKPLVANSGQITADIAWEADPEERQDITNYFQLLGDVLSVQEKKTHQFIEYTIQTSAQFDIRFGDYFFYTDAEIVPYSDNGANTVKLVAKHIEYSMTEDGLIRTIIGVRRFT